MICRSLTDIKNNAELNKILNKESSSEITIATIKYVIRSNEEEDFYTKEEVLNNIEDILPELEQSNRMDIFNFYKNKLTNSVNRKLVSSIVKTHIKDDIINQVKVYMEDYYADRIEIINRATINDDFKYILDTFKLQYLIDDEKLINKVSDLVNSILSEDEKKMILPLIYLEKFNIISGTLPTLNNKRLSKGETLLLTDKTILGLREDFNVKANTLFLDTTTNTILLLDKIIDGTTSVRLITEEELFTTHYFKH